MPYRNVETTLFSTGKSKPAMSSIAGSR